MNFDLIELVIYTLDMMGYYDYLKGYCDILPTSRLSLPYSNIAPILKLLEMAPWFMVTLPV